MDVLFHEFGIKTAPHYLPPYKFEIMREMGYPEDLCPEAERIYSQLTNTPMNMSLTDEQVDYTIESIVKTVEKLRSGNTKPEMNFS
jgi:dTDP-4-amino-4,6-dideoxygalactose transaminase